MDIILKKFLIKSKNIKLQVSNEVPLVQRLKKLIN